MTYTSHGHHIPDTVKSSDQPSSVARCGGVLRCATCKQEVLAYWKEDTGMDPQSKAKIKVTQYVDGMYLGQAKKYEDLPVYDVHIVWFSKTLQNWKALCTTTLPDGMYYEVTYDGDKKQVYLDAYKKLENTVIPD